MESKANIYRSLRRDMPMLPALMAWITAESQVVLQQRIRDTGFAWQDEPSLDGKATWKEQGFTLTARVIDTSTRRRSMPRSICAGSMR